MSRGAGHGGARPGPGAAALPDYRAPVWLPERHSQTIYPALLARRVTVGYRRERWNSPDGDFVDVDVCADGSPMLLVFHGLEGSSASHYARTLCHAALSRGWGAAVIHFRGCSGELNLAPRAYHSGDSEEIDWMLTRAARRWPDVPRLAVGVSLGANALLKWLGERGDDAGSRIRAAAGVSAPHDLAAGAEALSRGFNQIYTWNFLRTLKRKSLAKLAQHPGLFDRERMLAARSFHDFDEAVTAPMHGFRNARDYWQRSSCGRSLGGILLPTLVVNAVNDPFLPAEALPRPEAVGPGVALRLTEAGGHVGFFDRAGPGGGPNPFAAAVLDWMSAVLDHTPTRGMPASDPRLAPGR